MEQTLLLLQLSDSAFPTGGFAHSMGLESCAQHKQIGTTDDLKSFLICILENAGSLNLPFVQESHAFCSESEPLRKLDRLYDVNMSNHVAKRASSRQGKAMSNTGSQVFAVDDISQLALSLKHCHYAVVYGAVCGILGMTLEVTMGAFMSATLRTAVASAVRLDKLGPVEAQKIVAEVQTQIPDIICRYKGRSPQDACIVFPVPDVMQNCHDKLFCKLFYS
ncbi:hypothetical protein ACOMHN_023794 [Nucella lapillus]